MKKINMRLIPASTLFLLACIFIFSCTKENEPGPKNPPSKKELITRQWIQHDLIATVGTMSQSVFDNEIEDCAQDDIFTFNADGTFVITENTVKCSGVDVVTTGTWQLTANDTKVIIDPANKDPETLTIDELTETSFKGSIVDNSTGFEIKLQGIWKAK